MTALKNNNIIDTAVISSEIEYDSPMGKVHSDLGPSDEETFKSDEFRQTMHNALDEFLNNTNGNGYFYVGSVIDLHDDFKTV